MYKSNIKLAIFFTGFFFSCIFAAVIITQNNFIKNGLNNKQSTNNVSNLGLNDGYQESGNLSSYLMFQEFWSDVFAQDALNWSYADWRNYILLQLYGDIEYNLNNSIKNDPLFENNINVFTVYVMGKYNGSLSAEDITNLKSQLIHNSVNIGEISFMKQDDAQLKIVINIEVESSPSMWYVADNLEIYLKSENSSGSWYNESGTHYVKVYDIPSLELSDPIFIDGKQNYHFVGPILINTSTIEENISLIARVEYYLNFLLDDYVETIKTFNLTDDDESSPVISYTYTGDYTDGNPGELIISTFDDSGCSVDPSGNYTVPNSLGSHKFSFNAVDDDNDRLGDNLESHKEIWINITDDDTSSPVISFIYTGDGTDGNPGELIINASDISGLSLDPSGSYQVPNTIGNHKFIFTASDADDDRFGDILNTSITVWINITDDDTSYPELFYTYTGDGTDGNPGELIVNASDFSGLSLDPSGTYQVLNTIGNHTFVFTATDADNDRPGDALNTTITILITITDDDDEAPIIKISIIDDNDEALLMKTFNVIDNFVYDYQEFLILQILTEDKSGISNLFVDFNGNRFYDDNGDNLIFIENPRIPGVYYFSITAIDNDNDREGDQKSIQITQSFEVFDDDITPPQISISYNNFEYQIFIFDNDGNVDSKATGEYHLIDEEGLILDSGIISLEDFYYVITLPLKPGNYTLEVYSTNNDIEWEGDEEYNIEIFDITISIECCFQNIDNLLEKLIVYVDNNLYSILADSIRFKLRLAQGDLWDAYVLVEAGNIKSCVFNEFIVQAIIEFVEFETNIYNKVDLIAEPINNEIIGSLHEIRNFLVLLMGASVDYATDINYGYDIATIEVDLLNLADFVEVELGNSGSRYLEKLIRLSALHLELAIIKLSRGINPDSTLSSAQRFIDRAMEEAHELLENNESTEATICILLETLEYCYFKISEIIMK
ncbi:MAG: hypothetical protein ACW97V_06390 [Promethearchaeota archaeon]|jgi:hypothetical protein